MGNLEIKTLNNYIDLNVVILPNKEISTKLIKWSKFIASKFKSDYILDTKKHLPHLSLYSARYPLKNRRLLVKAVNDIVKSVKLFNITLKGFSLFSGYLFYDVVKNQELVHLHNCVVDKLNPLREGQISDNQRQLKNLSQEQKKAIEEYGYVSVKNLYMPHISITHLAFPSDENAIKEMLPQENNFFPVKTMAVSYFAEYGTLPKPFKKFEIKK